MCLSVINSFNYTYFLLQKKWLFLVSKKGRWTSKLLIEVINFEDNFIKKKKRESRRMIKKKSKMKAIKICSSFYGKGHGRELQGTWNYQRIWKLKPPLQHPMKKKKTKFPNICNDNKSTVFMECSSSLPRALDAQTDLNLVVIASRDEERLLLMEAHGSHRPLVVVKLVNQGAHPVIP